MAESIHVSELMQHLHSEHSIDVFDVRSPSEYKHARIPGARNVALLDDLARHEVGLKYKQEGKQAAVLKGFELCGPKFGEMIQEIIEQQKRSDIVLYCWRGGMRSRIMSWLLETAGISNKVLKGGYKSFRNHCLDLLVEPRKLMVVGGPTGAGKTLALDFLRKRGEYVIDLEELANHRGSAFGSLGRGDQPSNEFFENMLAVGLAQIPRDSYIWVENESRRIGSVKLPDSFYSLMREAEVIALDIPVEVRMSNILRDYGHFSKEELAECTLKLKKKLGGERLKLALSYLNEGEMKKWVRVLLEYYDENYSYSSNLRSKESIHTINAAEGIDETTINKMIDLKKNIFEKVNTLDRDPGEILKK